MQLNLAEHAHNSGIFLIFLVYGKNGLRWPQIGPGGFFLTNPDLADILGRTDLNFGIFYFLFLIFWTPNFQTPPPPPLPPLDELSDPNLTPLPTHPGIKYVARTLAAVSYTHLRAHETEADLVCRLLLEKKK